MDVERQRLFDEQTGDLYRGIGRCTVEWSQLMFSLRTCLFTCLGGASSQPSVRAYVAALKERDAIETWAAWMTASREGRYANGMRYAREGHPEYVHRTFIGEDDYAAITNTLRKWLHRLHDTRNRMVHDSWMVGWSSSDKPEADWTTAELWQETPKSEERTHDATKWTTEDLDALADEIVRVRKVVFNFTARCRSGALPRPLYVIEQVDGHATVRTDWDSDAPNSHPFFDDEHDEPIAFGVDPNGVSDSRA
jgi:hypothetical protein